MRAALSYAVVGQRQFMISLRYGSVLDKAAMVQLLTGEAQPPPPEQEERSKTE
jgi:hypothetical protein